MLLYGNIEVIRNQGKRAFGITFCGTPYDANGRQQFYSRLAVVLQQLQLRLDIVEARAYDVIAHSILNDQHFGFNECLGKVAVQPGKCLLEHLPLIGDALTKNQPPTSNFWRSICESRMSVWLTLQPRATNDDGQYWPIRSLQPTAQRREVSLTVWTNLVRDVGNGHGSASLRTDRREFRTTFGGTYLFESMDEPGFATLDEALPLVEHYRGRVSNRTSDYQRHGIFRPSATGTSRS